VSDYKFDCPHCGQSLEAPEDMLGETIDCPSCNGKLELPKPEPAPPPRPRPQRPRPQHTQQRPQQKQTVETNVRQGALIGGVVCFILGVIMMCFSLWTVIVYAPLFLAAFVLSIVAMAQKRIAGGVILLVLTVAVPPVLMIAVPSFKTARSAAQEAAQARAAVAATVEKEPEVVRTATVREPSKPEPEPEPEPRAKPALPTDPVYTFNFASLPSLPEGEEARLMVVPAYHYNDVWEMLGDIELRVTFGGEKFYVYVERDGFILTRSAVQELVSLMEKYRDWKTKALAMGTTVQKDIGTLSVEIFWMNYDDEWHWGTRPVTAACAFFSQNKQRHQMTMQFEKVGSTQNEYIDHRLETIYFDSEGVNAFLEAFSRSNIDKKVSEHKRQKQLESQFQ
jgi:DNA-directed RNA polymerase subunit RPC12/RpoP